MTPSRQGEADMKTEYLLLTIDAHVATVTINRPDKGNSLAPEVLEEIEAMFTNLSGREEVNVIVLTGGEKYFSAGFDLTVIRKLEKVSNEAYTALFQRAYRFRYCFAASLSSAPWAGPPLQAVST